MPLEWFCSECDCSFHQNHILHNRKTIINGFYEYISPNKCVKRHEGKNIICEQDCLLPLSLPEICSCEASDLVVSAGRAIILICINGRYDLKLPLLLCKNCSKQWTPDMKEMVKSGYWPATMQAQTLLQEDLFHSFEAMKTAAPGMSRQAFTAMLDQRTKHFGRTGQVNSDVFQRSFLQYIYCNSEANHLLGEAPLVCPACSPDMVAICVDGTTRCMKLPRLVNLPEGAKGEDACAFLENWLPEALNLAPSRSALILERAHRVGQKSTSNIAAPRTLIMKFLNYKDKTTVMRASRAKGQILFENNLVRFYEDLATGVHKKQNKSLML
ncbi:uncharacterized protein LOC121508745 [Cheilinus undulatus]|uniref:uncharacterized protein LOC121508745 n=1 Tax=Cheilinus undulatus TaxID=241271 RepID=UPI001BD618FF|nr:uncharacterized protein LOC121508745 [Cheilinus undulatus]